MVDDDMQALLTQLSRLMKDGEFHDLSILCEGREWKVHKAIVCSASEVFKRECGSTMREGQTSIIEHKEFDADTMDRMITYLYTRTYSIGDLDKNKPLSIVNYCLVAHANLYGLADYYQITSLKRLAAERFTAALKCSLSKQGFLEVIIAVTERTSPTDQTLRSVLFGYAAACAKMLFEDWAFVMKLNELSGGHEFTIGVLQHTLRRHDSALAEKGAAKDKEHEAEAVKVARKHKQELLGRDRIIEEKTNAINRMKCDPAAKIQRQY